MDHLILLLLLNHIRAQSPNSKSYMSHFIKINLHNFLYQSLPAITFTEMVNKITHLKELAITKKIRKVNI